MSHAPVAARTRRRDLPSVLRPEAWPARASAPAAVAVLLRGPCREPESAIRGVRTLMPGAAVYALDGDAAPGAEGARDRAARLRRAFAEIEADIYVLVEGEAAVRDAAAAAQAAAAVERDGFDLVSVATFPSPPADAGERLLGLTVDFLFGRGGRPWRSGIRAVSRRFAQTYRCREGLDLDLDLTLHALRLRLPVGEVVSLAAPGSRDARPARSVGDWLGLLRLVGRLLAEERPRRTFGLLGLAGIAAGLGVAAPALHLRGWHPALPDGPAAALSLGLMGVGAGCVAAGILLDTLAKARQDVTRLGSLAVPRRLGD